METEQLRIAHRMAHALNHTWGWLSLKDVLECTSAPQISELCHAQLEEGPCGWGITAPTVIDDVITHTSATERLRYSISEYGTATICICRPGLDEPILLAGISEVSPTASPTGDIYEIDYVQVMLPKRSIYQRSCEYACFDGDDYKYFIDDNEEPISGLPPLTHVHRRHVKALLDIVKSAFPEAETDKFFRPLFEACRPDSIIVINDNDSEEAKERLMSLHPFEGILCPNPTEADVKDQRVYGNIPLHLAVLAESVTVRVPYRDGDLWRTFRVKSEN